MSKFKISKKQATRIRTNQAKRLKKQNSSSLAEEQEGLVIAHFGQFLEVEDTSQMIIPCRKRSHLGSIVAGDKVLWHAKDNKGIVTAVFPRTSLLSRPDNRQQLKAIAANIDQMLIVVAPLPEPTLTAIDRYLVAAALTGIDPIIIFNKTDLLLKDSLIHELNVLYCSLGYKTLLTCQTDLSTITALQHELNNATSVLVGQSGVGKSSLLNALLPDAQVKTNSLSQLKNLGQHTTTTARLYHLPSGGQIIDSPGIRALPLWPCSQQSIEACFVEFQPFLNECQFKNCRHLNEKQCAILAAQAEKKISHRRLKSFHQLIAEQNKK